MYLLPLNQNYKPGISESLWLERTVIDAVSENLR